MDFSFTKEQATLQQNVRAFCEQEVIPVAGNIEKENIIPSGLILKLGKSGLFGVPFAKQYGGSGSGYTGSTIVMEELARASGAVAMLVGINYLAGIPIALFGTEAQKAGYLPRLCDGTAIGSFAFTEAATGSDPKAIMSEALLAGDEYILNGVKRFVTAADLGGIIVLSLSDGKGISAFVAEKFQPGYTVTKSWEKLGMHGIALVDISMENYRLPAANLLGATGDGFRILLDTIAIGKLNTCAVMLGCAQAALDEAVKYAKERTVKGKPMSQFQAIQCLLADIAAKVEASRWLTYRLANMADRKMDIRAESALAKLFVTESAVEAARLSFKVHGAYAYVSENKIERILRDVYLGEVVEGSNEMQKVIIANSLLKS